MVAWQTPLIQVRGNWITEFQVSLVNNKSRLAWAGCNETLSFPLPVLDR